MCADSIKNIKSISFYFNKTLSYELSSLRWKLKENHIFVMFYIWNWKWKPLFPISSYIKCLGWFRHSTKIWVWQTDKLSSQLTLYFAYTLLRSWPFTVKTKRKLYVWNIFPPRLLNNNEDELTNIWMELQAFHCNSRKFIKNKIIVLLIHR